MGSAPNARFKLYPRLVKTFYRPSSDEAYAENLRASLERIPRAVASMRQTEALASVIVFFFRGK